MPWPSAGPCSAPAGRGGGHGRGGQLRGGTGHPKPPGDFRGPRSAPLAPDRRRQRPRCRPADRRPGALRARWHGRRQPGRRRAAAPPPRGKGHLRPGPRRPRRRHPGGPGPFDQYRPRLPTRPRVGLAGGPGGHYGGAVAGPGNITARRRVQYLLRSVRRPGRLPLALDQDAGPPGRDQPRRLSYDLFHQLPEESTRSAASCGRSFPRPSAPTGSSSAWKASTSTTPSR